MKKQQDGTFKNVFFHTKGGQILKKLIEDGLKLNKNEYYIDYAYSFVPKVIARDKYGRATKYKSPTAKEASAEYKYLFKRIVQGEPDIIIPSGNLGCKALLGKANISKQRGVPAKVTVKSEDGEEHSCWVLPIYSMEYMLVNPSIQNLIESDFVTLKKYVDQGDSAFMAKPVNYEDVTTIERVREIFTKDIKNAPIVSWDLETNTLRPELPGAKPLVISLSWEEGKGCTIPLEHKDFTWAPEHLQEIYDYIRQFVADPNILKVGHNIQFDQKFLRLTKGFKVFKNIRDTKNMYYLLVTQEVDDSLKLSDLAYELTDMGGYDKPLEDFKKQYVIDYIAKKKQEIAEMKAEYKRQVEEEKRRAKEEGRKPRKIPKPEYPSAAPPVNEVDGSDFNYEWIPLFEFLSPYASGDVDCCLRIHNKLDAIGIKPENAKLRALYSSHYTCLKSVLAGIESTGVKVDLDYNATLIDEYTNEEERIRQEMRKFPEVQQVEAEHLALYQRGLEECAKPVDERDPVIAKLRDKYKNKLEFNPNSSSDKQKALFKYTGHRLPYNKEFVVESALNDNIPEEELEWYHYKTDKGALNYIVQHIPESKELADLLLTHSLVKTRKQNFTYKLRERVDPEGRIHGGFNSEGTACVTGDTLLVTGEGIREISSLSNHRVEGTFSDISIEVYSTEGREMADGFYYSGLRKGRRIILKDGTEIVATDNHPLLKNLYLSQRSWFNKKNKIFQQHLKDNEWAPTSSILEGDFIALKIGTELYGDKKDIVFDSERYLPTPTSHSKNAIIPTTVTEELAEWLGMFMADGCFNESSKSISVNLANDDEEVLDRFRYLTKVVFNLEGRITRRPDGSPVFRAVSTHVFRWVQEVLGVTTGAINKDVPECILQGTKKVQQAFIRGLTLDSSVHKKKYPSLYFCSVSKPLMKKLRVMLLNMGIYCSLRQRASYDPLWKGTYEVIVTYEYLDKYMQEIGLVESVKRDVIVNKFKECGGGIKGKRREGVIISEDYVFVRVTNIYEVEDEFFDLHVPKNHSFIGNGVVNHNTSRLSSSKPL